MFVNACGETWEWIVVGRLISCKEILNWWIKCPLFIISKITEGLLFVTWFSHSEWIANYTFESEYEQTLEHQFKFRSSRLCMVPQRRAHKELNLTELSLFFRIISRGIWVSEFQHTTGLYSKLRLSG